MDELLDRLVERLDVDREVAAKAVGIILAFLVEEGPSDKVQALIKTIPGAEAAVRAAAAEGGTGMSGITGVGSRLMAAGIGFGQMQDAAQEFVDFAGEKVSKETVHEIAGSIPGMGQFV